MASRTIFRLALLTGAAAAHAQGLPTTPPPTPPVTVPAATQNKPVLPQHSARVQFAGRTLQVTANNSSLNQILREIERVTGLKITGGVTDERVYGTYGPAETSVVLAALLGGTGSNMLLIVDRNQMPTELVLTPRQGGPTPPSPNTGGMDGRDQRDREDPDTPPQLSQHIQRTPPPPLTPTPIQPAPTQSAPPTPPPPAPASGATTTDQSPNGVKTPQQIYDQLVKLQQQQQKPPSSPDSQ